MKNCENFKVFINKVIIQKSKMEKSPRYRKTTIKQFEVLCRLGEGSFGQVYKVRRKKDNNIYAMKKIKTISMKQKDRNNALNQVRILASYNGQNIIGFKEVFYDELNGCLCIILEFAEQGDLLKKINEARKRNVRIQEEEIWKALVHITNGLKSLHDKNILHRDLKSANVFIMQNGDYKLGDLNVSKIIKNGMANTQTGTPYYASPEIWKDCPYGVKSDMWSLGCILYEMTTLEPPFKANDIPGLYKKVCSGVYKKIPNAYSNELSDLIDSLLKQNPQIRPNSDQLLKNPHIPQYIVQNIANTVKNQKSSLKNIIQDKSQLLETIKCQNKNWRNIHKNLPKPRYYLEKIRTQNKSQTPQDVTERAMLRNRSFQSQRLSVERLHSGKSRQKNINSIKQQQNQITKQQREKKGRKQGLRHRVLSAGKMRRNNSSVVISAAKIHNIILQQPNSVKTDKKVPNQRINLPPRPKVSTKNLQNRNSQYSSSNHAQYAVPPKSSVSLQKKNSYRKISRNNSKQNIANKIPHARNRPPIRKNNFVQDSFHSRNSLKKDQ